MFTRLRLSRPGLSVETTTYRKIKSINLDSFHCDVQASSLCDDKQLATADDLDAYAREYTATLSALLDRHAPLKTRRRRVTRPVVPWYNETIENQAKPRERRKAGRKTKAADDLLDYKSKRNYVTYLMNKARRDFYSQFMTETGANQKKLFNAAKKLLGMKDEPLFAEHLDKTIIANDIGRYFVSKVENIRNEIDTKPISQPDRDLVPPDKPVVDDSLKKTDAIDTRRYYRMRCSVPQPPKLYGLPKLHKPGIPIRPIVSFCGSPTYQLSKYLTTILQPLTDISRRKLQSTENFIDAIKTVQIPDDYKRVSFNVKSLFTSIPLQLALQCTETAIQQSTVTDSRHHGLTEPLPYIHLLSVQRQTLQAVAWNSHGVACFCCCRRNCDATCRGTPGGTRPCNLPSNDTALVTIC